MSNPPPGTLVHLRTHSLKARFGSVGVVLSSTGNRSLLYTDAGREEAARQQYSVPKKPVRDTVPMRLRLPFGHWLQQDGNRVLYSRDFCPLWLVSHAGHAHPAMPWWSFDRTEEYRYWGHQDAPWRSRETEMNMESLLHSVGATSDPVLVDALFLMLRDPDRSLRDAVHCMQVGTAAFS